MKSYFFIFLFLFLIPFANADVYYTTYDTWVTQNSIQCQCGVYTDYVNIFNTGQETTFQITIEGDDWASVGQGGVLVGSGETVQVPLYVRVPCSANSGEFTIVVRSISGVEKTIDYDVNTVACSNFEIGAAITSLHGKPCEPLTYSFEVANTGSWVENFDFKATRFGSEMSFSPQTLTLGPDQMATVDARLNLDCSVYGAYDFDVVIEATQNDLKKVVPVTANVERYYPFSLDFGAVDSDFEKFDSTYSLCEDTTHTIPVRLANGADVANKFDIEVDGATSSAGALLLGAGEVAAFNLTYYSSESLNDSIYFAAYSDRGDFVQKFALPVDVEHCYDVRIEGPSKIKVGRTPATFLLTNYGTREADVVVQMTDSENSYMPPRLQFASNTTVTPEFGSFVGVERADLKVTMPNGVSVYHPVTIVYGTPFWYTYGWMVVLGSILAIVLIGLLIWYLIAKKPSIDFSGKRKHYLWIGLVVLALLVLVLLPVRPVMQDLDNSTNVAWFDTHKARVNIDQIANTSDYTLATDANLTARKVGVQTYLYVSEPGNYPAQIRLENSTIDLELNVIDMNESSYFANRGKSVAAIGLFGFDLIVSPIGVFLFVFIVLGVLLYFILTASNDVAKSDSDELGKL